MSQLSEGKMRIISQAVIDAPNTELARQRMYNAQMYMLMGDNATDMDNNMFRSIIDSPGGPQKIMSALANRGYEFASDKVGIMKVFATDPLAESPLAQFFETTTVDPGVKEIEFTKIVQGDDNRFSGSAEVAYGAVAQTRTYEDKSVTLLFSRYAERVHIQPHAFIQDFDGSKAQTMVKLQNARVALQIAYQNQTYQSLIDAPPTIIATNPELDITDKNSITRSAAVDLCMFMPSFEKDGLPVSTVGLTYGSKSSLPGSRLVGEFNLQTLKDMLRTTNPSAHLQDTLLVLPKTAAIEERYSSSPLPNFYENGKYVNMSSDGSRTDGGLYAHQSTYEVASIVQYRNQKNIPSPRGVISEWAVQPSRSMTSAASSQGRPETRALNIVLRGLRGSCDAGWKVLTGKKLMENITVLDQDAPGMPLKEAKSSDTLLRIMSEKNIKARLDSGGLRMFDAFYTGKASRFQTTSVEYMPATHFGAVSDAFLSKDDVMEQSKNLFDVITRDWMAAADVEAINKMVDALMRNASSPSANAGGMSQAGAWAWAFANSGSVGGTANASQVPTNGSGFHDLPAIVSAANPTFAVGSAANNVVTYKVADPTNDVYGANLVPFKVINNNGNFRIVGASTPEAARYFADLNLNGVPAGWADLNGFSNYLKIFEDGWAALRTFVGHAFRLSPTASDRVANLVLSGAILPGGPDPNEIDIHVIAMQSMITALTGGLSPVWVDSGDQTSIVTGAKTIATTAGYSEGAGNMLGAYAFALTQKNVDGPIPTDPAAITVIQAFVEALAAASWTGKNANEQDHRIALSVLNRAFTKYSTDGTVVGSDFDSATAAVDPRLAVGDFEAGGTPTKKRTRLALGHEHFSRTPSRVYLNQNYVYGDLASPSAAPGLGDFEADLAVARASLHDSPLGNNTKDLPVSYRTESLLWERRTEARFDSAFRAPAMVLRLRSMASCLDGTSSANALTRAAMLLYLGMPMAGETMGCLASNGIGSAVRAVYMATRMQIRTEMGFLGYPKCGAAFVAKFTGNPHVVVGKRSILTGNFEDTMRSPFSGADRVTNSTLQVTFSSTPTGETDIELARVTASKVVTPERLIVLPWAKIGSVRNAEAIIGPDTRGDYVISYMGLSENEAGQFAPLSGFVDANNPRIRVDAEGFTPPFSGLPLTMMETTYISDFESGPSARTGTLGGDNRNQLLGGLGALASQDLMPVNSFRAPQADYNFAASPNVLSVRKGCSPLSHILPESPTIAV